MSPQLPYYLGPYKVVSELGEGGFATVFEAIVEGELGFERQVALKVLHAHLTKDDPEIVRMLADEARLMALMEHPNIVHVQWFGQLDHPELGQVFAMVMEYVPGRTLRSLLDEAKRDRNPLPLSVVLDLYIDLARALAFAHALTDPSGAPLGLVHRDLKPDNVIVSEQGVVKLLDFGLAKAHGRLAKKTATGVVRGTVRYMSPEQVEGSRDLDLRSDLFSFGSMLYEAINGRRLINSESVITALRQIANFESNAALASVTRDAPGLAELFRNLLAPDREQRIPSADLVVQALETMRRGVDSDVPTSTYLRQRVARLDDTAPVETPANLRRPPGPAAASPAGIGAPRPVSPPAAAPAPRPPVQPSVELAQTGIVAVPRARSWIPWVAAPLVLVLGAALSYLALRAFGTPADPIDAAPTAEVASEPAPAATPEAQPPPAELATVEPSRPTPVPPSRAVPRTPREESSQPAAVHPAQSPAPGRLRLSADHPFELSLDHARYTARDARRGIELPVGSYTAEILCLQCPAGVATSMTATVTIRSGETSTQILSFPPSD